MSMVVYLNGNIVSASQAQVSIFDRGFLYGDGLFETMRAYSGKVFRLEQHLERLFSAAEIIFLNLPWKMDELREAVYETLKANNLEEAYVRLTVSRGEGSGAEPPEGIKPNLFIFAQPFSSEKTQGARAVVTSIKRDENSPLSRIKSLNFLPNILACLEAKEKKADEAIMLNSKGFVAEGATSNLFLVLGGKLLTPSPESGILPGVTRAVVLELAKAEGLTTIEKEITLTELVRAEEAFLTNSLREIIPLISLNGNPLGKGCPGELTHSLALTYRNLVKKETASSS